MILTREKIIQIHGQIVDAILSSKKRATVELTRLPDGCLMIDFWSNDREYDPNHQMFEGLPETHAATLAKDQFISFLRAKGKNDEQPK